MTVHRRLVRGLAGLFLWGALWSSLPANSRHDQWQLEQVNTDKLTDCMIDSVVVLLIKLAVNPGVKIVIVFSVERAELILGRNDWSSHLIVWSWTVASPSKQDEQIVDIEIEMCCFCECLKVGFSLCWHSPACVLSNWIQYMNFTPGFEMHVILSPYPRHRLMKVRPLARCWCKNTHTQQMFWIVLWAEGHDFHSENDNEIS